MALAEAVAHIEEHDACDRPALKQLRDALGHRKLYNKWEDQIPNHPGPEGTIVSPDWPPNDASSWQQADIHVDMGKVFDPSRKRWRTLLILKFSIFQLWPKSSVEGSESGKAGPIAKAKVGAPSDKEEMYQAYHRLSQLGHDVKKMAPTELAELIAKECGKKLGEPRWAQRTVLQHIQCLRAKH
jgi:hypothetical protein